MGNIRECDAIIHVIRCFDDDNVVREGGAPVDPAADKDIIDTELQLKDLETIEGQLAKQEKIAATGNKDAKVLVSVLKAYKEVLDRGENARTVTFDTKEELKAAHDLFLLTTKPVLYVCNVDDASAKNGNAYVDRVREAIKGEDAQLMVISAQTEADIAELESYEEKQMFLEDMGLISDVEFAPIDNPDFKFMAVDNSDLMMVKTDPTDLDEDNVDDTLLALQHIHKSTGAKFTDTLNAYLREGKDVEVTSPMMPTTLSSTIFWYTFTPTVAFWSKGSPVPPS